MGGKQDPESNNPWKQQEEQGYNNNVVTNDHHFSSSNAEMIPVAEARPLEIGYEDRATTTSATLPAKPNLLQVVVTIVLGFTATILSACSIFTCFVIADDYDDDDEEENESFMLYGYDCLRYAPASAYSSEDTAFRYGRIASVVGAIGGMVCTLVVTVVLLFLPRSETLSQKAIGLISFVFGLLSAICASSLVALSTEMCSSTLDYNYEYDYNYTNRADGLDHQYGSGCISGPGFMLSASASVFFFLASVSICCMKRPQATYDEKSASHY